MRAISWAEVTCPRRREACGVFKCGIRHAQLCRPLVHLLHKGILTAGDMFRQSHGAVVGGNDAHGFQHLPGGHLFVLLQPDLGAAHGAGVGGGGNDGIVGHLSAVNGLHGEENGHNLGDAGRFQLFVLVFGVENCAGFLFHQEGRGRRHIHSSGAGAQYQQCAQQGQKFFMEIPLCGIGTLYEKAGTFMTGRGRWGAPRPPGGNGLLSGCFVLVQAIPDDSGDIRQSGQGRIASAAKQFSLFT